MNVPGYINDPTRKASPVLRAWYETIDMQDPGPTGELWENIPAIVKHDIRVVRRILWWTQISPIVLMTNVYATYNGHIIPYMLTYNETVIPVYAPQFSLRFTSNDPADVTWGIEYESQAASQR